MPGACESIPPTSIPMDHMTAKIPHLTGGKNPSYGANTVPNYRLVQVPPLTREIGITKYRPWMSGPVFSP